MSVKQITKVEPWHLVAASLALLYGSWFSIHALYTGSIRMHAGSVSSLVTRQAAPENYWVAVLFFLLMVSLGWVAVGLNAYRIWQGR